MDLMRRMDALEAVEKERHEGKDADEYGPVIAKLNDGDANTVVCFWILFSILIFFNLIFILFLFFPIYFF